MYYIISKHITKLLWLANRFCNDFVILAWPVAVTTQHRLCLKRLCTPYIGALHKV